MDLSANPSRSGKSAQKNRIVKFEFASFPKFNWSKIVSIKPVGFTIVAFAVFLTMEIAHADFPSRCTNRRGQSIQICPSIPSNCGCTLVPICKCNVATCCVPANAENTGLDGLAGYYYPRYSGTSTPNWQGPYSSSRSCRYSRNYYCPNAPYGCGSCGYYPNGPRL
jgi:hypothetical protein